FTVSRVDPAINVTIADVTYPQNATAVVNISNNANGTVKVYIGETEIGNGAINNGHATIDLTRLAGGVHEVTVKFITTDDYNNNITTTAKFLVNKADSTVIITRDGLNVIATVTTNATGYVTFIVNGVNKTVEIIKGNATWFGVLDIGENYITAIYEGDANFTGSRNITNFLGNKTNSTVNVTATNVTYGKASEIIVKVGEGQTGFVRIIVIGTNINVTAEIIDGIARFNATDLNVGKYEVNVTYIENEKYYANTNNTYFNISKANMSAAVTGLNVTVVDNIAFIIDNVTKGFNGKVNITVNGTSYDGDVKALIDELGKLKAGSYTAKVTFYGDNNYNNRTYDVNFTVSRVDPTITVRINDTTYPNKAVAEVNVTNKANGTVFITVDSKTFNATMTDGRAFVDITGLAAGVKDAVIKFETNDTYNNNISATARFNINKADSSVKITRNGTDLIATVTTNATRYVTFIVNNNVYQAPIINGNATWKNVLKIGDNYVTVIYNGDVNFTASSNIAKFNIGKANSTVNVTATTVVYTNASEITVKVPNAQTGFVRITVNGTDINVTVEINNGIARFNATGLDVGRYMVNVTYLGNEIYLPKSNITYFNITKANMSAAVTGLNVTVKDNIGFVIDNVTDDFSGKVKITVEGQTYDDIVKALVEMGKLKAGKYTAKVTFYDDNNYNNRTYDVNFTVSRVDPAINVTIADVTYPQNATAVVNISNNANGTVKVYIGETEI
ncbi:hypothetical protein, partial [Methanobrevibacter sp.]